MGWEAFSLLYSADALGNQGQSDFTYIHLDLMHIIVADVFYDRAQHYKLRYARSYSFSHATDEDIERMYNE